MLDGEGPLKAEPFYYQLDRTDQLRRRNPLVGPLPRVARLEVAEIDNPLWFQKQYYAAHLLKLLSRILHSLLPWRYSSWPLSQ